MCICCENILIAYAVPQASNAFSTLMLKASEISSRSRNPDTEEIMKFVTLQDRSSRIKRILSIDFYNGVPVCLGPGASSQRLMEICLPSGTAHHSL